MRTLFVILGLITPLSAQEAYNTQKYYHELKEKVGKLSPSSKPSQFEKLADEIDDMPILDVDNELVSLSVQISDSLRYQSRVQRVLNIEAAVQRSQTYSYSYSYWNGYYYQYQYYQYSPNYIAIDADTNYRAKSAVFRKYDIIKHELASIRVKLTDKYHMEFR